MRTYHSLAPLAVAALLVGVVSFATRRAEDRGAQALGPLSATRDDAPDLSAHHPLVTTTAARIERQAARDPEEHAAAKSFGVRIRVLDAEGRALVGVPISLFRRPGEAAPVLLRDRTRAEPAQEASSRPGSLRTGSSLFQRGNHVASGITRGAEGEAFLALGAGSGETLLAACTTLRGEPAVAVVPAVPPPLVELRLPELPCFEIAVRGQGSWWIDFEKPHLVEEWIEGAGTSSELTISERLFDPQRITAEETLCLPYLPGQAPQCSAIFDATLAPLIHLEPDPTPRGGAFVLDAERLLCQASVRVLRVDGSPWSEASLELRLIGEPGIGAARLRSDAEGRVRFWLRAGAPLHGPRGLRVTCPIDRGPDAHPVERYRPAHPDEAEAHLELSRSFAAGEAQDLGSLRQGDGPLLYAGRVVDRAGRPVEGAFVRCDREDLPCDAEGRFRRCGIPVAHEVRVEAFAPHFGQREPLRVLPPARDLELVLEPNGALRFALDLPGGLDARSLVVEFQRRRGQGTDATWETRGRMRVHSTDSSFAFEDLALGTYRFSIQHGRSVLHHFELEIASGARDLGSIDLRELVQPLRFQLVPALGLRERLTLQLFSGAEDEAAFAVRPDGLGNLDLWIPKRCDRWVLLADEEKHEGRCDQPMPIDLR